MWLLLIVFSPFVPLLLSLKDGWIYFPITPIYFPIRLKKFTMRLKKFPVRLAAGIGSQPIDLAYDFLGQNGLGRAKFANFPVEPGIRPKSGRGGTSGPVATASRRRAV